MLALQPALRQPPAAASPAHREEWARARQAKLLHMQGRLEEATQVQRRWKLGCWLPLARLSTMRVFHQSMNAFLQRALGRAAGSGCSTLVDTAPVAHRHACAQCGETERRLRECRGCRGCAIAAKSARCSTGSRVDTGSSAPSWQRAALRSDGSGGQTNNGCFCSLQCQPNCGFDQPVLFCLCATCSSTVSCT